jgi:hypothetical protein
MASNPVLPSINVAATTASSPPATSTSVASTVNTVNVTSHSTTINPSHSPLLLNAHITIAAQPATPNSLVHSSAIANAHINNTAPLNAQLNTSSGSSPSTSQHSLQTLRGNALVARMNPSAALSSSTSPTSAVATHSTAHINNGHLGVRRLSSQPSPSAATAQSLATIEHSIASAAPEASVPPIDIASKIVRVSCDAPLLSLDMSLCVVCCVALIDWLISDDDTT